MKKLFAASVFATVLTASAAFAYAQLGETQGRIDSVDPAGQTVTLVNGMTLSVPSNISIESLKPGEQVTITYQDGQDGQKQVTGIWVDSDRA